MEKNGPLALLYTSNGFSTVRLHGSSLFALASGNEYIDTDVVWTSLAAQPGHARETFGYDFKALVAHECDVTSSGPSKVRTPVQCKTAVYAARLTQMVRNCRLHCRMLYIPVTLLQLRAKRTNLR